MNTLKQKLTSRKLWVAIVGIAVGLSTAFGLTENDWGQIAGVVGSVVSGIVYIMSEAKIDAAAANPVNITFSGERDDADVNDMK